MNNDPPDEIVDAWIALLHAQQSCLATVENAFKDHQLPRLSWYDVLWELERGKPEGMRPTDFEKCLLMPQYGLSRLLVRLEKAGYIERGEFEGDERSHVVKITQKGLKKRRRMWPVYANALNQALSERITRAESKKLSRLLVKLTR